VKVSTGDPADQKSGNDAAARDGRGDSGRGSNEYCSGYRNGEGAAEFGADEKNKIGSSGGG